MKIFKSKYKLKNTTGGYDTVHFETSAEQVVTNDSFQFVTRKEKENWNNKLEILSTATKIVIPEEFGAKGDGITNDSEAINNAINKLKEYGGGTLQLSKGAVYLLGSLNTDSSIINCTSNLTIEGDAKFKIKDNFGDYSDVFNFQGCHNVTFRGFTLDENTKGNPKTNLTGDSKTRIAFSSWHDESYNIVFEDITINDCIGVWQITVGDRGKKIKNVSIKNCTINYNTQPLNLTYDRTSVYLGCESAIVEDCTFNGGDTIINANTCIEFHGDNIRVRNNRILNYNSGIFICNDTECTNKNDNLVAENNYIVANTGILMWFEFNNRDVNIVNIKNNYIAFEEKGIGTYDKQGANCKFRNINIEKNTLIGEGSSTCKPLCFSEHLNTTLNSEYNHVNILNNTVYANVPYFIEFESQPDNNLDYKNFVIKDNYFKSSTSNLFRIMQRANMKNILFDKNIFDVDIVNTPFVYGSDLRAVTLKDNTIDNVKIETLTTDNPIKIIMELKNFNFISNEVIDGYIDKFVEGSIFKGATTELKIMNIDKYRFISSGIVPTIPKKCFLDKGSKLFIMDEGVEKVVIKEGYMADRELTPDVENKKGEWLKYGMYVTEVKVNNTSTDTDNTDLFSYVGEAAEFN